MANFTVEELESGTVYDENGAKVGDVAQLYLDDATGEPNWVTVNTGLFGTNETFVPLDRARTSNGEIHVPYTKDFIKDAPNLDADAHIEESEERDLYRYYGLDQGSADVAADAEGAGGTGGEAAAAGFGDGTGGRRGGRDVEDDRAARGHDPLDARTAQGADGDRDRNAATDAESMVRHEEEVRVGTERVQTGRARLRKRVVKDTKTVTVPVEREEFEVVREPVGDGETHDGGTLGEDDVEVTLTEQRPVVDTEVVAKERVGLGKNVVRDQEQVQAEVGREEVEVVRDDQGGRGDERA
ncbi:PRC and DUF2382 domain-containing protein [Kocuria coralli]|nr:PRC and DUF2382 domain-containing protein [Kocuria coralli]